MRMSDLGFVAVMFTFQGLLFRTVPQSSVVREVLFQSFHCNEGGEVMFFLVIAFLRVFFFCLVY
jgi:hypothetical protein